MDRNNSMDRRHLNYSHGQPLGPVETQTVSLGESEDTLKNKDPATSLQGFGWCPPVGHPQFYSQRAALYGDHFSTAMASAPPASGSFNECMSGAPEEFSNSQIHMNGPGSYQRILAPELHLRRTGVQPQQPEASSSSIPWEGNARLHHPNAVTNPLHHNMSLSESESSEQQREGMLGAVPKDVQQNQHAESGSALDSRDENKEFWEHRCENCGRQYRRPQELRRHTRDKHEQQPQCPFCHAPWSRPEKIRAHLITEHGDRFTDEQNQELHGLRGRRKTMHFIAKCATPTPPP